MKLKIAGLLMIASTSGAWSADMPGAVSPQRAPYLSPAYNWTGFYIGAMGGYGQSQNIHSGSFTFATTDIKGGFGGGTVGYNFQTPGSMFVLGIEADAAWSDIKYSSPFILGTTFQDRIRDIGSLTGRVGIAADAALFYFKGGYAWADNRIAVLLGPTTLFSESKFHSGWTVGGGIEYGFTPNWSAKAEYMYASFTDSPYLATFTPGGVNLGLDLHTVKFGLNYRFGGGPVVARY